MGLEGNPALAVALFLVAESTHDEGDKHRNAYGSEQWFIDEIRPGPPIAGNPCIANDHGDKDEKGHGTREEYDVSDAVDRALQGMMSVQSLSRHDFLLS